MITAERQALPEGQSKELREWLDRPGFTLLLKVLAAHQKEKEAEAVAPAMKSIEHPLKIDAANAELQAAHRYAVTIAVLNEVVKQTTFEDVKLH